MIEDKIKEILVDNTHTHYEEFGNSGNVPITDIDIETATHQVRQLLDTECEQRVEEVRKEERKLILRIIECAEPNAFARIQEILKGDK